MAQAIRLISSLLNGENENVPKIQREFADNFPKKYFSRNYSKIIFLRFSVDFQIFRELSENFPKNNRSRVLSNPTRWSQLLKKIENVCGPKLFQNSRQNSVRDKTWKNAFSNTRER